MKKTVLLLIIISLCTLFSSCNDTLVSRQGFYFDTMVNISVNSSDADSVQSAFDVCKSLENVFSRTKEGSELWKINNKKNSSLSPQMKEVLDFSLSLSAMTDGAFDVTSGKLTELWNIKNRTVPPSDDEIENALKNTGYNNVSLSPIDIGETTVDLGAVAKGYAADIIRKELLDRNVKEAIIDLGGNIALIGEYTVGIRNPFSPDEIFAKITLKDKSAVTSGSYQRYFDYDGKRYHHIIDARTGKCAESGLSSVTVISTSSLEADALSTAIFILGKDGLSLCEKFPDADVLIIDSEGNVVTTDGFIEKYNFVRYVTNSAT